MNHTFWVDAVTVPVTRLETCVGNQDPSYLGYKAKELYELLHIYKQLLSGGRDPEDLQIIKGQFCEGLFYHSVKTLSPDPQNPLIIPSTGDEDAQGIDFFLDGFPIDVTVNMMMLSRKISKYNYTVLVLPQYIKQPTPEICGQGRSYIEQVINGMEIDQRQYITDTIRINRHILNNLHKYPLAGINTETNMVKILDILSSILQ